MKKVWNIWKKHYFGILVGVSVSALLLMGLMYTYYCFVVPNAKSEKIYIRADNGAEEFKDLPADTLISQNFSVENQRLSTIKVWIKELSETSNDKVRAYLYADGNDTAIQEWKLSGDDIKNGHYTNFSLDNAIDVKEKTEYVFKFYFESESDSPDFHAYKTHDDEYAGGNLFVNGSEQTGDLCFKVAGGDNRFLNKTFILIIAYLFIVGIIAFFIIYKKKWKYETIFLFLCLTMGMMHWFLMPTYTTPDEKAHFATAYYYANELLGEKAVDENGNVLVRECDREFSTSNVYPANDTYAYIADHFFETADNEAMVSYERGPLNVASFAFFSQILGIAIARLLHLGCIPLMFLGSMLGLLFYSLCCYFAIKFMPFGKMILCTIALLPMIIETAASFSYDVVLNGLSFLFIGYTFYLVYKKEKVVWKDWVFLGIVLALLAPIKVIYILLALLCILIPVKKCTSRRNYILSVSMVIAAGILLILLTRMSSVISLTQSSAGGVRYFDLDYIIHHLSRTISTAYNTLRRMTDPIWRPVFGGMLGTWNVDMPWYIFMGFLGIVCCSAIAPADEPQYLGNKDRTVFTLIILGIIGAVGLAMLMDFTPIGTGYILGIQGRYFYPVLPLMFLVIRNKKIVVGKDLSGVLFMSMFMMNYFTLWRIFETVVAR
ncbi:MAG: DUF2142 domain-containing protein [Lachnospiraceae bacterium]|nr:DUF2142 domain-containing protein [Lachnospiraceae bacterium]